MNEIILGCMLWLCEEKLKELMPEAEYQEFIKDVSRKAFNMEIDALPDSDFKDFCVKNFDMITQ